MDKVKSRILLLSLFSIFFIYKAIMGVIENNVNEIILWSSFTIIYIISLTIAYLVFKRYEKEKKI